MPEHPSPGHAPGGGPRDAAHARPFVHESLRSRSLYFSIDELQSRMQLRDPFALDLASRVRHQVPLLAAPCGSKPIESTTYR